MSNNILIMKKSTAKKILAIALCVVILSVAGWFSYRPVYSDERAALLADQWQVEKDLGSISHEVAILKSEVNRLQSQLSNLQSTLLEKNSIVVELNIRYYDLKSQVTLANQTVSDLENQLAEAQFKIQELSGYSTTVIK
jgi:chromosome segregation ATPase